MRQDNLVTSASFPTAIYSIVKPKFLSVVSAVFEEQIKKQKASPT
jgi:hypothetical protein